MNTNTIRRFRSRTLGAVVAVAVAVPGAVAGTIAGGPPAHAAISCATATGQGPDFYHGPRSSNFYDTTFTNGPKLSAAVLKTHVPQGLATWPHYFGAGPGTGLLVYAAHHEKEGTHRAYIQGLDPRTGKLTSIAQIAGTHASGIAIHGQWAFVTGRKSNAGAFTIRTYRLSDLRRALEGRTTYVKEVGTARSVYGASFLAAHAGILYAGRFNATQRDKMYRYKIGPDGALTTQGGAVQVPKGTQGLLVTSNRYVFSTSLGRDYRSNIYVTLKGKADLDQARPHCFRAPSMAEGITQFDDGRVYLIFESGARVFAKASNKPRNIIANLHRAPAATLLRY